MPTQCVNREVRADFMKTFQDYQDFIFGTGANLLGSQPTQGNIRGGLTTIEEKALGNVEKMGRNKVMSVLKPAESPRARPALYGLLQRRRRDGHPVRRRRVGAALLHHRPGQHHRQPHHPGHEDFR